MNLSPRHLRVTILNALRRGRPAAAKPAPLRFRGRIPELDGLRAVAVLMVFLLHFGPSAADGSLAWKLETIGWTGVDLFFVLSGFLITGTLLDDRDNPSYYRNFYIRRTLRVLPLYYALLATGALMMLAHSGGLNLPGLRHNLGELGGSRPISTFRTVKASPSGSALQALSTPAANVTQE